MHPAFSFGFKNGPVIPKAAFGFSVATKFKSGHWQSELVQGISAVDAPSGDDASEGSVAATWMQFLGDKPAWKTIFTADKDKSADTAGGGGPGLRAPSDDEDAGEEAGPVKKLLDALFGDEGNKGAAASQPEEPDAGAGQHTSGAVAGEESASSQSDDAGTQEGTAGTPDAVFSAFAPVVGEDGIVLHDQTCPCPGCGAREEGSVTLNADSEGSVSTAGTSAATATLGDMAEYLTSGYWADKGLNVTNSEGTLSHNLGSSGTDANNGVLYYNVSGFSSDSNGITEDRKVLVREAFKLFEATLGIDFEETTSTSTSEVDFFFSDNSSGAWANYSYYSNGTIATSYVNVASSWSGGTSTYNDYTLQTIFHEIGHALGLGHQGNYNGSATFGQSNNFANDSWQASMMSYFSQGENTNVDASGALLQTPMSVDWMALDAIYGSQGFGVANAFTENTTWGFNTTVTSDVSDIWAQWSSYANKTASTLVDGGGIDTLDLSGYGNNSLISLIANDSQSTSVTASNIGGRTGNLTIAEGTVIENAIGGAGSETFYGNSADNVLTGNGGNDTFHDSDGSDTYFGGSGSDTVLFSGDLSDYSFAVSGSFLQVINIAVDLVDITVEWLGFADQTVSYQSILDTLEADDNTAPDAQDDGYTVDEDGLLTGENLLGNDTDADGDALSVASVNGSAASVGSEIVLESGALLTVNADGTFSYDQNGAFDDLGDEETATETFTYVASDGEGTSEPATVTITIEGSHDNTAPVSADDGYTVDEDGLLTGENLLGNDTDADGDALSVASVNGSAASVGSEIALESGALLTVNADGTFSYDQNGAFDDLGDEETATETFTYVASDGEGTSEPATVTITIEGSHDNTAPVSADDGYTVDEDGLLTGENLLSNDTDADGDALSVASVNGSSASVGSQIVLESGALLTVNADGTFSYDQNGAFDDLGDEETATETFTYVASDGEGTSEPATVTITIEGSHDNTAPVSADDGYTVDEDGLLTGQNLLGNDTDADGDALSVASVNGSAASVGSQIVLESGALLTVNADGTFSYDQNGAFDDLGDEETATETFTYVASDGEGTSEPATVTITIEGSHDNTAPVSADDGYTVDEDGLLTGENLLGNDTDADGDALSVASVNGSAASVGSQIVLESGALLTVNADGTFSYDQNGAFDDLGDEESATETFTYVASDGEGTSEPATVTITIEGSHDNTAPVSADDGYTVDEDGLLTGENLLGNDTDADGDALSVASVNGSSASVGSQIVLESGALLTVNADGTFSYDQNGAFDDLGDEETATETFTYVASDGEGTSEPATVTITIEGSHDNTVPDAVDDAFNLGESGTISANLFSNDTDADNDALTVVDVNGVSANVGSEIILASGARLTVNADGTFDYDPNGAFDGLETGETGADSFTYQVSDGKGGFDTATVNLSIDGESPPVEEPLPDPIPGTDKPVVIDFEGLAPGAYTGEAGFSLTGVDVTSSGQLSGDLSGATTGFTITAGGSDFDLDSLLLQSETRRARVKIEAYDDGELVGSVKARINSKGVFELELDERFDSVDEVVVTSRRDKPFYIDDVSLVLEAGGAVGGNADPVAANDVYATSETGAVSGRLLDNDGDADGGDISLQTLAGRSDGTALLASGALVTFASDGTFTYDPNGAFDGLYEGETATDVFVYEISDGNGGTDTAQVEITVEGEGAEPVETHIGFEGGAPCRWFDEEDGFVFADTYGTTRSKGVAEGDVAGRSYGDSLSFARADGESFDFEEAVFTLIGRGKTTVTIEGYLDGELVGTEDFRFRANKEKTLSLSDEVFDDVDEVVVTSKYGVILDDMTLLV